MNEWKEGVSDTFHRKLIRPLAEALGLAILIIALLWPEGGSLSTLYDSAFNLTFQLAEML